jgi:hypothetical protein
LHPGNTEPVVSIAGADGTEALRIRAADAIGLAGVLAEMFAATGG